MEFLAEIHFIMADLGNDTFEVKSWHWVHVTHIVNPHSFFVRRTKHLPFIKRVESHKPLNKCSFVNIHDIITLKLKNKSEDTKYARGKIINIKEETGSIMYDVFMLDYGYIKKSVKIEDIWACDKELYSIPPLSIHCQLGHCMPVTGSEWTETTTAAFKYYVGNENAKINILDKTNNQLVVELFNSCPDDVATLLAFTGYSTFGYVKSINNLNKKGNGIERKALNFLKIE